MMKSLYCKVGTVLFGLILMTINLQAQVDTTYATRVNYIFNPIDKTKIPYGLLKDAALEMAELKYYKGEVLQDSNRVFIENWRDIYKTLFTSKMHTSASATLPNPDVVDSVWFAKRQPGQVTLAGLYYTYSRYDDEAATKVTIVNDQVYDKFVNGQWQNPYKTEQVLAFAPANVFYPALGFSLYMPPELWLSNQKNQVAAIQCDASDGLGYRTLKAGVTFPVFYADTGIKVLNFKIILTDNTVLQSHSLLRISNSPYAYIPNTIVPSTSVKANGPANVLPPGNCISGNVDASGLEKLLMISTESFNGKQAKGLITVKYAQADHQLHKPLIVVEGFDTGIYSNPENLVGDSGLEKFVSFAKESSDLDNLLFNFPQYDIIFIDWQNGTADMRLNALLLKTVIRCVNQVKVDPAVKNVVLGQSMGGVIARYALKKMEDAAENHDTRLFISHDAPQQGANVPLAFQAAVLHLRSAFVKPAGDNPDNFSLDVGAHLKSAYLMNTPAAKQLLVNRINNFNVLDDATHIAWQSELAALGYPQQTRNVAISNGSECGTASPIVPGDHLIYLDGYYKTSLLTEVLMALTPQFFSPILGLATRSWKVALYSLIPGSNKFSFHIEANALPANGFNNFIYQNKIIFMKRVLWLIPIKQTIASKTVFAPPGLNNLENFPGGFFSTPEQDTINTLNPDNLFFKGRYHLKINKGFSFIPTTSALDIGGGNVPLGQADYYAAYVGGLPPLAPKHTPFANFTTAFSNGSSANEEHITFTQRNGNWLAKELTEVPILTNCATFCNLSIGGIPCLQSGIGTYSVPNMGVNSVQWAVSGPAMIISPTNTNQVTLLVNGTGMATLYAQINSDCGTITVQKNILIGINQPQIILTGKDFNGTNTHYFKITNFVSGYTYNWYLNNNFIGTSGPNYDGFQYQIPCNAFNSIYAVIQTDCGFQTTSNTLSLGNPCNGNIVVYPNPANTEISISVPAAISAESIAPSNEISFEVKLYYGSGKLLLTKSNVNNEPLLTLNTQALPTGNYYLHVSYNNQVLKKQILIQH